MKDSDWFEADAVVENVAEGYTKQTEQSEKPSKSDWRRNIYTRPARGSAAGGGYATVEDLLRFIRALYECRLLSEVWTNWVFTGVEPEEMAKSGEEPTRIAKMNEVISGCQNVARTKEDSGPNVIGEQAQIDLGKIVGPANLSQSQDCRPDMSALASTNSAPNNMENANSGHPDWRIHPVKGPAASSSEPEFSGSQVQSNLEKSTIARRRWGLAIAGSAPGINAVLEFESRTGFTIIVLANYDPPAAGQIGRMVRRYLEAVKK
ncbi:MAG: hypothetical protein ACUVRL_06120 [Candidatus Saccharicenans sp.]|uniref:hypothetical protein n=1 Tax=Candidatus Saccharicenans sp. TaxID=2819258 RepID=UPI00404B94D7